MIFRLKPWIALWMQPRFDIRLKADAGTDVQVVERPGLWWDDAALERLQEDLRTVARAAMPEMDLHYGVFLPGREALARSVVTLVRDRATGKPIAFNALALIEADMAGQPTTLLHLGLVCIDPGARGKGLSWILYGLTCFLLFARNGMRPLWVSNVTQVPAVAGMVAETFEDVYPSALPGARRSLQHLLLARSLMGAHRYVFGVGPEAGFDEERFVATNAYTGGSDALKKAFEVAAHHRNPVHNAFCAAQLDYERGDDLVQIGRISMGAATTYLRDHVPRRSLAALGVAVAAIALQRALLPVTHWLDTTRPWRNLQPWKP
jgi:hypothetical protein